MGSFVKRLLAGVISLGVGLVGVMGSGVSARGETIGDVVRLKNEQPNELIGFGLVVGLKGTGDGGDFMPAMRPLKEMLKKFDDPVMLDKELKNANNVAIVMLSANLPEHGAVMGDKIDVHVSAIAAKSLKGGTLILAPLAAPTPGAKVVLGYASGQMVLEDEATPTQAVIKSGGKMIEDVLPEEIKGDTFTMVLRIETQSVEKANSIAEAINEEVSPQTEGKAVATAPDATSVEVTIPKAEQANKTAYIARLMAQPLPEVRESAKVLIDRGTNTMVFTGAVEVSPTSITQGGMTITIGKDGANAKLKELMDALDLLKVSDQERVVIVQMLAAKNALKAAVEYK